MGNSDIAIGRHYDALTRSRGDPTSRLIPADHLVNWGDKPFRFKVYGGGAGVPLGPPGGEPKSSSTESEKWSALLGTLGAPLRRKISINWNESCTVAIRHASQSLARGPASGGGLYPTEFYLCVDDATCFRAGIYHYDGAHHSLILLSPGKFASQISAALGSPAHHHAYLLISVDFWKSAFKYHNFAYQVCSQDAGAALAMTACAAINSGMIARPYLWFADEAVNKIAGLDTANESVFAVAGLTLCPGMPDQALSGSDRGARLTRTETASSMARSRRPKQRSKRVAIPSEIQTIHRASLVEDSPPLCDQPILRSEPSASALPLLHSARLTKRHSSWGSMRSFPATDSACVQRLLGSVYSAIGSTEMASELALDDAVRLAVYANHLRGLERGLYDYCQVTSSLTGRTDVATPPVPLQALYNLQNYNLEQVGCLILAIGNVELLLGRYGNRGIRMMHVRAGMAVQCFYLKAVELGLECGAVLGVRVQLLNAWLRLPLSETVLVGILLGRGLAELSLVDMSFRNELWA